MVNLRVLVAICPLVCASAAHADWQYTKWGMTPEQVRAASPDVADVKDGGGATLAFPVHARYTGAGVVFDARFGFDRKTNKLSKVLLSPAKNESCDDLESQMSSKYGTPVDASTEGQKISVWKDQASGNRIEFQMHTSWPTCWISYYPITEDANNGL